MNKDPEAKLMAPKSSSRKIGVFCMLLAVVSVTANAQTSSELQSLGEDRARELAEALKRVDPSYAYHGLRAGHGSAVVGGSSYRRPTPRARASNRQASGLLLNRSETE